MKAKFSPYSGRSVSCVSISHGKGKNTFFFFLFPLLYLISVERQADRAYMSQMLTGYYHTIKFPHAKNAYCVMRSNLLRAFSEKKKKAIGSEVFFFLGISGALAAVAVPVD